jgi:uncharacterized protein (TIGR03437 family)
MQKLKLFAGSFLTALFLFPAFCQAQTVSIVSGNGQLVCPDCPVNPQKYAALMVQVNDSSMKPVAGATVTWTITQPGSPTTAPTSVTNSAGQASLAFAAPPPAVLEDFFVTTVVASATVDGVQASTTFYETTAEPAGAGTTAATISLVPASAPPVLTDGVDGSSSVYTTGETSTTAVTPIVVSVLGLDGGLGNVQVSLQSTTTGLTIGCETQPGQQAGTVLTNSSGYATCTPLFGTKLGSGYYTISVGVSYTSFGETAFSIVAGPPSKINLISPTTNISVNAGTLAPATFVAQVTDAGGNPSSGAAVVWKQTLGLATLSNTVSTSLSNGDVSSWITPTAGSGPCPTAGASCVQVTVSLAGNSSVSLVFTVYVNTVITAMQPISGNNQTALEGAAFTDALIVQVNDNSTPVEGATVDFAVTSGPATLGATNSATASAATNAQGQAQVTVTASAATSGPVVITATTKSGSTTYTLTFNLTVNPPGPTITGIVNSAGFQNQDVSPCSLATISGTGFAPTLQGVTSTLVAPQTQVANLTVQFGGVMAPILWVANINGQESAAVQVPCETPSSAAIPPATVPLVVAANGVASSPFPVTVLPLSPGIFQFTDSDKQVRAVVVRSDGSVISVTNKANPGDILRMFVTGLGQTTPPLVTDEFDPLVLDASNTWVPEVLKVNSGVIVGVGGSGALVLSAQYSADMVGVYEVDFQVPENAAANNNSPFAIVLFQGTSVVYGNPSAIPIQ